jgi:cysteine desulfuration protein SufE
MEPVPECMTPVFLFAEKQAGGGVHFYLDIPRQSPTVRGLASILSNGLDGCTPEEIIGVPSDFFLPMNLDEAVSQQRLTGFMGVLAHMKQEAVKLLHV